MGAKISSQKISKSLNRFLKVGVYEVKHTGKQNGGYITDEKITGIVDTCGSNSVLDRLQRNFRHDLCERLGRNRANQHYPCRIGEYHS